MPSIISRSPAETFAFGETVAARLTRGAVLALAGEMGAGKTHFIQGLARGLGIADEVTSPTFTLVHEYRGGRLPLYHLDFYRLESDAELLEIGIDDYLPSDGVTAIEWAGKFARFIPPDAISVSFEIRSELERKISIQP